MGIRVVFIDSRGVSRTVEAQPGASVMATAVDNKVPEVQTDCGGVCTCAACHVYVDPAWADRFEPISRNEDILLSLLESRRETSRLSCQLKMTEDRDGAVIQTIDPAANT